MMKHLNIVGLFVCFASAIQAQNLQQTFQLTDCTQLNLAFPVQSTNLLQARESNFTEMRVDIQVKANAPQSTLQLMAQAGRYNLNLECNNGSCTLNAPNLEKKINLHGTEIQEQISVKAVVPSGTNNPTNKQLSLSSGKFPTTLKIRWVLEGTAENYGITPQTTTPTLNQSKDVPKSNQIDIE